MVDVDHLSILLSSFLLFCFQPMCDSAFYHLSVALFVCLSQQNVQPVRPDSAIPCDKRHCGNSRVGLSGGGCDWQHSHEEH